MGNRALILAGVKAGGAIGSALANFAPPGTALPTSPSAVLDAAFEDAGWITEDGLKKAVNESSTAITAYGTTSPVRTLITQSATTFVINMLESNPTTIAVYNRLPLDAIVPDVSGAFDYTEGEANQQQYSAVFDLVDGPNRMRMVVPICEVTDRTEIDIKSASAVTYGVTLTAYPGSDGVAIHTYYLIPALASV